MAPRPLKKYKFNIICPGRSNSVRSWCDGSLDRSFMGWTHWAIFISTKFQQWSNCPLQVPTSHNEASWFLRVAVATASLNIQKIHQWSIQLTHNTVLRVSCLYSRLQSNLFANHSVLKPWLCLVDSDSSYWAFHLTYNIVRSSECLNSTL